MTRIDHLYADGFTIRYDPATLSYVLRDPLGRERERLTDHALIEGPVPRVPIGTLIPPDRAIAAWAARALAHHRAVWRGDRSADQPETVQR